jgi:hypothetical protein
MARPKGRATKPPARRVRVRSRPLAEIDEAKLATALALMARRLLEQRTAERAELEHGRQRPAAGEEVA